MSIVKKLFTLLFLIITTLLVACTSKPKEENRRLQVVCTTGMIGDALKNIVGDSASVVSLMGAGVDPHLYKATQGDLQKLSEADIIFYNGLHLEGKMGEILEKLGKRKAVVALADGINKDRFRITNPQANIYDPHIWFDVSLWADAVNYAGKKMEETDKKRATYYKTNTENYLKKLTELHEKVKQTMTTIPQSQRLLITSHDAFGYFGRAYQVEVHGLQGISTVAEFGLKDISDLVKFIIDRKVKSIFVETSVSQKSIEAVLEGCKEKGHQVSIGGQLFSDAMGAANTPEGTYIGMVEANVATIVKALK